MPADPPITTATLDRDTLVARLTSEGLIGPSAVARRLGSSRGGRPVHPSTITRWMGAGHMLADGRVVRLEAIRVGGLLRTSWAAVLRYLAAQQEEPATDTGPSLRSPAARNAASAVAEKELIKLGC